MDKPDITIAVVIPSWSGAAQATLDSCAAQSWAADEVEVAIGISPNGRARNVGVRGISADYIVFVDDDAVLGAADTIENLVRPLVEDANIHITGASKLIPLDSPWFQRWVAREVPRIEHPVIETPLVTNPDPPLFSTEITTTCCAIRRVDYERVGGFDETLVRGVDTEFFVRARRAGLNFVLVPHTWTWHPAPKNLYKLWRKHFLYGMGHAGEVRADATRAEGLQQRPFLYLLFRTVILIPNIFIPFSYNARSWRPGFKLLKATTSYVSALG
ncbi:MAG: glycosyltransferase family 2 protein, partial [Candidatus Promineifilaceae bacterium]